MQTQLVNLMYTQSPIPTRKIFRKIIINQIIKSGINAFTIINSIQFFHWALSDKKIYSNPKINLFIRIFLTLIFTLAGSHIAKIKQYYSSIIYNIFLLTTRLCPSE